MLTLTKKGLYCQAGNFYIDPNGAVDHAVVTHAHSDHARRGSKNYYCARSGTDLLRGRIGKSISVTSYEFGEYFTLGEVNISFHPAGHILGSSQVRLEFAGEVWVASGDYKREFDPTCEPFENVECDVFVTEATFGTPAYTWPKDINIGGEIFEWWNENAKQGINSLIFAYSLGKTQRILGTLEPYAEKAIYCHPAATALNECYREQGIKLAPTKCLSTLESTRILQAELIIAPQSFLKSAQAEVLGQNFKTAFASGWMARGNNGYDRGFLMSDHADWNDLLQTIAETKAKRIYVQHRGNGALVKHLRALGLQAYPDSDLALKNPDQLAFF